MALGFLVWEGARGLCGAGIWQLLVPCAAAGADHTTQLHKQTCGFIEGAANSPQLVSSALVLTLL